MSLDLAIAKWIRSNPQDLFVDPSDLSTFQGQVRAGIELPDTDFSKQVAKITVFLISPQCSQEEFGGEITYVGDLLLRVQTKATSRDSGVVMSRWSAAIIELGLNINSLNQSMSSTGQYLNRLDPASGDTTESILSASPETLGLFIYEFSASKNPYR